MAIPTLDGAAALERTLTAVRAQTVQAQVVVLDSSSRDGTRDVAARFGAEVHVIAQADFGHGRARNQLMDLCGGDRVAFLTQDAVPADDGWLERLTAPDAALSYGPYVAPPDAPASLRREYAELFAGVPPRGWISSANLCLARSAWQRTPFRDVPYAEDQALLRDLGGGVYVPEAGVLHAHEYSTLGKLRRSFDEFRALHELHGVTAPLAPHRIALTVRAEVRRDRAFGGATWPAVRWQTARALGAALGTRAHHLPPAVRASLSLERRPG